MDRPQEEMQFVGFFGIYRESFKIIFSWKKIFTQITLALILPLTFIFLAHMEISKLLFSKIEHTRSERFRSQDGSYTYSRYSHKISSQWVHYWLFKVAYLTFVLIFSLLSTAAVVYTIASIYTGRDVTFKKVMKVIPRVWKRLIVTFLCMYLAFFTYSVVAGVIIFIWARSVDSIFGGVILIVFFILYAVGFLYMSIVWQLASVVTVLESAYGFKAMMKAKDLIKGKRWVAIGIFFVYYCIFVGIITLFVVFVVFEESVDMYKRVVLGLLCLLLLLMLFLFGLVSQTVLYLVCKSYHHQSIDKVSLSTQLGSYLGEYQPFQENKDVQLAQSDV